MWRTLTLAFAGALGVATMTGCGAPRAGGDRAAPLSITGVLNSRAPVALPPDSVAVVELRDAAAPEGAPVAAEHRTALQGRQAPVAFTLAVDRSRLAGGRTYQVRGGVVARGRIAWVSEPMTVDTSTTAAIDVGTLWIEPVEILAFATTWHCGGQTVRIGVADGDRLRMVFGTRGFDVHEIRATSGNRFEAVGDPATFVWDQGGRATIEIEGRALRDCVRADAQPQR